MKRKHGKIGYSIKWTPFEQCNYLMNGRQEVAIPAGVRIFKNNVYTVNVEDGEAPPFGTIVWLSIKRNDRQVIHDWRDLQRIKNEICGPEREAVELYPAESRLVDTSQQYHLWVMPEGYAFPFGYKSRLVIDETVSDQSLAPGARQRPWPKDAKPADAIGGAEYDRRWRSDPTYGLQPVVHKRKLG